MSAFKHSFTFVKALVNSYDLVSNRVVRTSTRQSPNRGCNKLTIQWLPYRLSYRTELKSNISQFNGMILANIFYIMQCAVYVGVDICHIILVPIYGAAKALTPLLELKHCPRLL